MKEGLADLVSIARCSRAVSGVPGAVKLAYDSARNAAPTYERIVAPLVKSVIEPPYRDQTLAALRFASSRYNHLLASYARMTGRPFRPELAALAGSFSRLYDDLVDETDDPLIDARLSSIFRGAPFTAATSFELLLEDLYDAIDRRLERPRDDAAYRALDALHTCQVRSRRQKDPALSRDSLYRITHTKGGLACLAVFSLVFPEMDEGERCRVAEVGRILQGVDDYTDLDWDRRAGIATPATRGYEGLDGVGSALRRLHPQYLRVYGTPARQFLAILYMHMVVAFRGRRLSFGGHFNMRRRQYESSTPVAVTGVYPPRARPRRPSAVMLPVTIPDGIGAGSDATRRTPSDLGSPGVWGTMSPGQRTARE